MGRTVIKIKDYYLVYSSICDAPITEGLTLDKLVEWYKDEYGKRGLNYIKSRLDTINATGTSSLDEEEDINSVILCNRAGPNECKLTLEERTWEDM